MKKILISCCTGLKNSGDEAILQSMLQSFKTLKGLEIKSFSFDPAFTRKIHNIDSLSHSILKYPVKTFKAINWCDILLLGGGGLLQDETSLFNIPFWLSKVIIARLFKKRIYIYANSIGPVQHRINRKLIKIVFNKADVITLRDNASKKLLKDWGVTKPEITITADAVFNIETLQKSISSTSLNYIPQNKFVVVFLRHWYDQFPIIPVKTAVKHDIRTKNNQKKWDTFVCEFCKTVDFLNNTLDLDVVFLSMCPGRDVKIAKAILNISNSQRNSSVNEFLYPTEIIRIISKAEFIIGMRLHSIIYAIIARKPFISISYSLKSKALIESIGMSEYGVDIENISGDEMNKIIRNITHNKKEICCKLDNKLSECKDKTSKNLKILAKLLE